MGICFSGAPSLHSSSLSRASDIHGSNVEFSETTATIYSWLVGRYRLRLLGYCWDEDEFLLVYEFMPNGSLECDLFKTGNDSTEPLSWNTRLKIAKGAARGLAFLHPNENKVIFRDFNTSNILLDEVS
ncbi:hypothetical protein V8G54_002174 [Vigna mungo]|uniref:Protein kinase domain-containing protein n=1 Tax=Vigna mungo TaxID=3915 RepID=A0AAQ3P9W2_VIGMU